MAQMVDTAPQPTPPAAAPAAPPASAPAGPPLGGVPPATQILHDQRAPQRASLLDGLRGLRPGGDAAAQPAAAAGAQQGSVQASTPGAIPAAAATDPATGAVVAQPSQPPTNLPTADATAAPTSPPEPEEHPGMVQVRKAEQHARQRLAEERAQMQADFDRQRAAWSPQLAELDRLKGVIANARQDPAALFAAAGFTDADYEPLAQIAYSMSPEIQKDPRAAHGRKIAGMQSLAARTQAAEQEKIRAELQALRDEQSKRDADAVAAQNVQRYLQTVTRAVGDTSPHVRYAMGRAPESTQQRLLAVADRLYTDSGPSNDLRDVPTPAEVLKAYEQERRDHIRDVLAELDALGIDPRAYGKAAAPAAPAAPAAAGAPPPAVAAAPSSTTPAATPAPATTPAAAPATPATPAQAQQAEDEKRRMALEELRKLRFAG